jgi:hypothetical protein
MERFRAKTFKYWRDPLFLGALVMYAINRCLIKPHLTHYSPFFHGHLNDCLFMPVAIPVFLWVYRVLGIRSDNAPPRLGEVILLLAMWSLFFKGFSPLVLHRSVWDPIDIFCYAVGGLMGWLFWNFGHQRNFYALLQKSREALVLMRKAKKPETL